MKRLTHLYAVAILLLALAAPPLASAGSVLSDRADSPGRSLSADSPLQASGSGRDGEWMLTTGIISLINIFRYGSVLSD